MRARKPNFHYLPTLSRALDSWAGLRGYVQDHVARIIEERAARLGLPLPVPPPDPDHAGVGAEIRHLRLYLRPQLHGSSVRDRLAGFGWHRKQIVFERYD